MASRQLAERRSAPARTRRLTRDDVIATALEIVEEGHAELGVHAVARRLGIKPPSLYNHVTGNPDLRHAVALEGYKQLADHLLRRSPADRSASAAARIRRLAKRFRSFARAHPHLYPFLAAAQLDADDPDCRATVGRILSAFREPLGELGLASVDVAHALRALRAAVHGFVSLELAGQFNGTPSIERSFDALVQALLDGWGAES